MNDAKIGIATVTLCFQFGFFWQTLLGAKQKTVSFEAGPHRVGG
jgi:hypothetical protein